MFLIRIVKYYFRALQLMKLRHKGATKGHSLLKKKLDALQLRFRAILKKILDVYFCFGICSILFCFFFD